MEKDYVNPYLQPGFVRDKGERMPRAAAAPPPSQGSSLSHVHFWEAKMRVRACACLCVCVCVRANWLLLLSGYDASACGQVVRALRFSEIDGCSV